MSRPRPLFLCSALLATVLAGAAWPQGAIPFTIEVRQGDTVANIGDGGVVSIAAAAIGQPATASVTLTYTAETATNIEAISPSGSTDFSVTAPVVPFSVDEDQFFTLTVRYLPTSSVLKEGQIAIQYTSGSAARMLTINLKGTAPEFGYSFVPQGGNATQIAPGGTVALPETTLEQTSTATFTVTNRGTAEGLVESVALSGAAYAISGLPLLPAAIPPNGTLTFNLRFTPETLGAIAGSLTIGRAGGPDSFTLAGDGVGALFEYQIVRGDQATPLQPGALVTLDDTLAGETTSVLVRVRNAGNADGVIGVITVSGSAYELTDLPFLPVTVAPASAATFTLTFAPETIGPQAGRLKVGDAEFGLTGDGVGSFLEFMAMADGRATEVAPGGKVIFAPAAVGGSSAVTFTIANAGTEEAAIASISLGTSGSAFSLTGAPDLPLVLAPGASASFTIAFEPRAEGAATTNLLVDTAVFILSGNATPPPPLPDIQFEGEAGAQPPRTQPAIGLAFAEPYALNVTGSLTLAFASEAFANDPSVQFSTGGRTVEFEIPAGETHARFANGTDEVRVQTGSVAGRIAITAELASEDGADLTPDSPPVLEMTIAEAAPVITHIAIADKTLTRLTLQITGFATNRAVSQMGLSFQGRSGENLSTTSLNINASSVFAAWYQNSQSVPFGSQFTATLPLTFSGDTSTVTGQANAVESVSVTLSNSLGASQSVTVENPE